MHSAIVHGDWSVDYGVKWRGGNEHPTITFLIGPQLVAYQGEQMLSENSITSGLLKALQQRVGGLKDFADLNACPFTPHRIHREKKEMMHSVVSNLNSRFSWSVDQWGDFCSG